MAKVWSKTQKVVKLGLQQESSKNQDPFNEFMQSESENSSDESQVDLLPCLQVTVSVMNLLTNYDPEITQTTTVLR